MSASIYYRHVDLPGLPQRPEDEPDYDEEFIAYVKGSFSKLPLSHVRMYRKSPYREDLHEQLACWRRDRPQMWNRLCKARIAIKYALILMERQDAAIEDGARQGLCASESILLFGNSEILSTPEDWDYETEFENWKDAVLRMGFDPEEVLAFLRGEEPEWPDDADT